MDKQIWQQAEHIFYQASELAEADREGFISEACGDNPELLSLVQNLLRNQGATLHLQQLIAGQAAQLVNPPEDLSGQNLGPYRLLRLLGVGGMGAVYLAERADKQFEKQVAIKLIATALRQPELLHAFKSERQILATLEHSYICRLLDGGTTAQGMPYLVMEYVQGDSITEYCQRKQLSVTAILQLFVKVGTAVAYAHQNMVVHCDIKPSNILISSDGEPRLLDFGIARLAGKTFSDKADAAELPLRRVTPSYAAPELVKGQAVSTLTDVYSLGKVLQQLLDQHQLTDLHWIVKRALQHEPEQRYGSAMAFISDIKRYLGGYPVQARPDNWYYRIALFIRRNRASSVLSALVLVAVTGFSIAVWQQSIQLKQQRDQAVLLRDKAQAISSFVTGMLSSVDPLVAQGQVPTVQQVLQQTSKKLQSEQQHSLSQQPEVEAAIHQVLGRSYFSLGLLATAQTHLEQAKQLAEQHQFIDSELYFLILTNLAALYKDQYKTSAVLNMTYQALALAERLYGKSHLKTLGAISDLASAYHTAGELEKAESMWLRLYQERLALLGADHPDIVNSLTNLGIINHWLGRYAQAEHYYQDCLDKAMALFGEKHPASLQCLSVLGSLYETVGRFADALPLIKRHIRLAEQVLGAEHPDTLRSVHNLADTYRGLGRLDTAQRLFRDVLARRIAVLGKDNIETLQSQMKLARVLMLEQQASEAQALLSHVYSTMQSQLGSDHPSTLSAGQLLADAYLAQHNYQAALALYQNILQQRQQRHGDHPDSVDTLAALAKVQFRLQNTAKATQLLLQAEQLAQQFPQHSTQRLLQAQSLLTRQ